MAIVGLELCKNYDFDKVYAKILELFKLVPPPDFKNKTVLLKPNILYPKKPELAVCTHPVVVGAVVKAFVEGGAKKVIVGESPAMANSTLAAKSVGMYEQVIKNGGEWVDFSEPQIIEFPSGKVVKQFSFAKPFFQADIVVSLAKLKTHQFMAYTGAMKNLFGLIIGLEKAQTHYRFPNKTDFADFITDLNLCANPTYAIMDAIVGMEGEGGPGSGTPKEIGFLAASQNILALDWTCASLVGYNPHTVPILEQALQRKTYLKSENEIQTVGASKEECKCPTFKIVKETTPTLQKMLPNWVDVLAKSIFIKTPHFNPNKCVKCKRCEQICPVHIISMSGKNGTAKLTDRKKCLHCFCCHEICIASAIKLRHF